MPLRKGAPFLSWMIVFGFVVLALASCGGSDSTTSTLPSGPSTVSGVVTDNSSGTPIDNAVVVLGTSSWTTLTASNGSYTFTNIPLGTYPITVVKNGFALGTGTVTASGASTKVGTISLPVAPAGSPILSNCVLDDGYNTGTSVGGPAGTSIRVQVNVSNLTSSGTVRLTSPQIQETYLMTLKSGSSDTYEKSITVPASAGGAVYQFYVVAYEGTKAGSTETPVVFTVGGRYSQSDLTGTWYGAGIRTPVKGTNNSANFGYDVDQTAVLDNGTFTVTTISTSDSPGSDTGTIVITPDGVISVVGDTSSYMFMNAGKDVLYQFWKNDATGEQQLFFNLKKAASYSQSDLTGTWYGAGIKTPVKGTSNSANFGYDVDQTVILDNGSFSATTISTSDTASTDTGTITITSGGGISVNGIPDSGVYMNAGKDVMFQFWTDATTEEQQLFIMVKKAASYSQSDLTGTWYSAGIKTPVKGTSNSANFGFDVDNVVIQPNGSFTLTTISTSDVAGTDTGMITIASGGVISINGVPDSGVYMNAGKDVMFQFWKDDSSGEQQLFIMVKKR